MTSARADAPPPARDVLAGVRLGEGEDPARDGAQRRASLHGFPKQEVVLHGPVPDGDGGGRGGITHRGGRLRLRGGRHRADLARARGNGREEAEVRFCARGGKPSANAFRSAAAKLARVEGFFDSSRARF